MFVAVVSKKGGVGKTTVAVNLAAALAERGQRVLLVDLDPQASASLSLGIDRTQLAPSAADLLLSGRSANDVVRRTRLKRLDLLTSSADLADVDRELISLSVSEEKLREKLDPVRDDYEYVLFDCAPGLSLLPTSALVASDAFLVPSTPHFLAIEGLYNFLQAVDRLGFRFGRRLTCAGIVLNNVDYRTKVTRQNVARVRDEFGDRVFAVELRVATKLAEAPAFGKTILEYARYAPPSLSFGNLADEFVLRLGQGESHGGLRTVPEPMEAQVAESKSELDGEESAQSAGPRGIVRL